MQILVFFNHFYCESGRVVTRRAKECRDVARGLIRSAVVGERASAGNKLNPR